jgi:hypothetical protein
MSDRQDFELYALVLTKLNQEGDGIWSRFNYLIGLNVALIGIYFFTLKEILPIDRDLISYFLVGISLFGLFITRNTFLVLRNLWKWELHWKQKARQIERSFPPEGRLLHRRSASKPGASFSSLTRDSETKLPLLYGTTQPTVLVFGIAWLSMLAIATLLAVAPELVTSSPE